MLKPNKSIWFEKIFAVYNRNLIKRRFHSLKVKGLEGLLQHDTSLPLVIYANHSSWWDGLAAFEISKQARLNAYIMMEEKQLRRYFLFRKLGAFSVNTINAHKAARSISFAIKLLKNSKNTLWIFPQGKILPSDKRPMEFSRGLSKIIEKVENCSVVSVVFRYEFLAEFKPELFALIDRPEKYDPHYFSNLVDPSHYLASKAEKNLGRLKNDILSEQFDEYKNIV